MWLRRRETAESLAVQMIELEAERACLQAHLYGLLQNDTGSTAELRRDLDEACRVTTWIDRLRQELPLAEARSLPIKELI